MVHSNVAHDFARAVIDREFGRAYGLTTEGYRRRTSLSAFTRLFEDAEDGVAPPRAYALDGNAMSFADIATLAAATGQALPDDVDAASVHRWTAIEFQPGPDDGSDLDACYDFWCMTVNEAGAERIAHFEVMSSGRPTSPAERREV